MAKGEKSPQLLDWRSDQHVIELREQLTSLQGKLAGVEKALASARHQEAEAPEISVANWQKVFNGTMPEAEARAFDAKSPERTQLIARFEGERRGLDVQRSALQRALAQAEDAAQHASAKALQEAYQVEAVTLLQAYEALAASSARMHTIYQIALAQFPIVAVYHGPTGYSKDIRSAAGLERLYDEDAIRAQRGTAGHLPAAPWDRLTFGGRFRQIWDGLRRYLGLPEDRGEMTPEGEAALKVHQERGRVDREVRESARQAAIKAARLAGAILPSTLRAS
jgi:hypothetical protein